MKRLILIPLAAVALGLGLYLSRPAPVCAQGLCGAIPCVTSAICAQNCACIGGVCTSFQAVP